MANSTSKQNRGVLRNIARTIMAHTTISGDFSTSIPGLSFFRHDNPAPPSACLIEPSIVVLAQGSKQTLVGGQAYLSDTSGFLVNSHNAPAAAEVLVASAEAPCVGLVLRLDLGEIAGLIAQASFSCTPEWAVGTSVAMDYAATQVLRPLGRLVTLLEEREAIAVLAPLIQREIYYRLLVTNQPVKLRQTHSGELAVT